MNLVKILNKTSMARAVEGFSGETLRTKVVEENKGHIVDISV